MRAGRGGEGYQKGVLLLRFKGLIRFKFYGISFPVVAAGSGSLAAKTCYDEALMKRSLL